MKRFVVETIILAAAAALALTGCERLRNVTGTPVRFSVGTSSDRSNPSNAPQTKVSYGDISGTTTKSQEIDWKVGDKITIYCAQCEGEKSAEYAVSEVKPSGTTSASYAKIENAGASGLQWGTGTHKFYSVYPGATTSGASSTISGKDITGSIPANQTVGTITGTDAKVVAPDMKNLYMSAKTSLNAGESGDPVFLDFKPLTTVLEFTITNQFEETKSTMNVTSISLISDGHALDGGFAVDMDQTGLYGRPKTTLGSGVVIADCDSVSINFGESPVELAYEKTLNFHFFLNPGNATEVDDLTFEIKGVNDGSKENFTRRAKLEKKDKSKVTFPTHKKTRITGIMVPESIGWEINGEVLVTPFVTVTSTDGKDYFDPIFE